jgi:hypothetical protein
VHQSYIDWNSFEIFVGNGKAKGTPRSQEDDFDPIVNRCKSLTSKTVFQGSIDTHCVFGHK